MWPFQSAEQRRREDAEISAYQAKRKAVVDRMNAFAAPGTKFNYRGVEMLSLGVWGGFMSEEVIVAEFKTADGRFEKKEFGFSMLPILQAENPEEQP